MKLQNRMPSVLAAIGIVAQSLAGAAGSQALPIARLSVAAAAPAFTLANPCTPSGTALTLHVRVTNTGQASSPAGTAANGIVAQASVGTSNIVWSGDAKLPAVPALSSVVVDVPLQALVPVSNMAGSATFTVLINPPLGVLKGTLAAQIAVTIPTGFCAPKSLTLAPGVIHLNGGSSGGVAGGGSVTPTYQRLEFTIVTGDDDLRGDSSAYVQISVNSGLDECTLKSKSDSEWQNNSVHKVSCGLEAPQTIKTLRAAGYEIHMYSSQNLLESNSPDNWNINGVTITAYDPSGSEPPVCVYHAAADPLVRLHGDGSALSFWSNYTDANHC